MAKKSPIQIAIKLYNQGYIAYGNSSIFTRQLYNPTPNHYHKFITVTEAVYKLVKNLERQLNKELS